jgi:site-specific recombinase XerD
MDRLTAILSDVLEGFRVEELKTDSWTANDDDLIASFVSSLNVQGRSQKTIKRYVYVISRFMKAANTTTRSVTVYHIRDWLAAEKKRGIQESTLEGNRTVLSSYFSWLFREGLIEKNPITNVGVIKVPKKQKKTYSDIDFEKLNQCCETIRDRAIIHFLRSTGCRISEMCGLDRDMVDLEALECVVHGKGNKDRTVYLDPVAGMVLNEYLKQRTDTSPALFAVMRGQERIQPNGVRVMLKKLGRIAGVDHVHPHKFRRTLATDLARHGMPIQEVANLLGHEKLDTTMRYVVLNKEEMKHNYRRYA